jgi:hypothetical protein
MGLLRSWTGADAQERALRDQTSQNIAASQQAADAQVRALNDSARAVATEQMQASERAKAEQLAADSASKPLAVAEVSLDTEAAASSGSTKKRRAQFGKTSYGSGVSI